VTGSAAASVLGCGAAVNNGPQHYVVKAAIAALNRWVGAGVPPLSAARFVRTGPTLARDAHGIARGGIRTPVVDVPVATESGQAAPGAAVICALFGSSTPFPAAQLTRLYGDRAAYLTAYDRSARAAVSAGHVLAADLPKLQAQARSVTFAG
jgi:hypothetical protein